MGFVSISSVFVFLAHYFIPLKRVITANVIHHPIQLIHYSQYNSIWYHEQEFDPKSKNKKRMLELRKVSSLFQYLSQTFDQNSANVNTRDDQSPNLKTKPRSNRNQTRREKLLSLVEIDAGQYRQ